MDKFKGGFSLLELLIVLSIVVVIASIGSSFYLNYGRNIVINSMAETMTFDLKQAQSRSMIGEGGFKWGVHFVNGTQDYYEIFSTPTDYSDVAKVIISKNYLTAGISFYDPTNSLSKDIIFDKISGSTAVTSIVINSSSITKTINVSSTSIGSILIQ